MRPLVEQVILTPSTLRGVGCGSRQVHVEGQTISGLNAYVDTLARRQQQQ
ncbi:MAG TPA: hypothetical protein VF026_11945 [Ktedonobacteraceae bacterium]